MYENIQKSIKNVGLKTIMAASNVFGRGIGKRKIKPILEIYPTLKQLQKLTKEDLLKINGFAEKTAQQFIDKLPFFIDFLKNHPMITIQEIKKKKIVWTKYRKHPYYQKNIVFTGFTEKIHDKLPTKLKQLDINLQLTVTKNTDLVVAKDLQSKSSKLTKAKKNSITIISYNEFINKVL